MDERTSHYYTTHAKEVAARYEHAFHGAEKYFRLAFTEGQRVLDIGAGSGRDMALLKSLGCDVYGVEPCEGLRAEAAQLHPEFADRITPGELPELGEPFGGGFDGVLCSAVLMHLPREQVFDAAFAIRGVLRADGILLLSIPKDMTGLDSQQRDNNGRLFTSLSPDYLNLLFERLGFQPIGHWASEDSLARQGRSWWTLLFRLRHGNGLRPADQIEGVLSRDRKTATYKLALFRSLSEIAVTEYGQAQWLDGPYVGIPIKPVIERWLNYYWPIFDAAKFIPQIRGEAEGCEKPVAFRESLTNLAYYYRMGGGLSRFTLDYREQSIPAEVQPLVKATLRKISDTIVSGPVTYSGGSLETGRVFRYDARHQLIVMSAGMWQELSLLGHWIQEAVVLRWAELTSEIAKNQVRVSETIELLLTTPIPERDVSQARQVYGQIADKECAWTGKPLKRDFGVDHIIPFSLWHNNDLWNLVPALPSVNSDKRDRLPTHDVLLRRGDCIIRYWEVMRIANSRRFDFEVCRIAGAEQLSGSWQRMALRAVSEAVEVTSIQRGCERWEP